MTNTSNKRGYAIRKQNNKFVKSDGSHFAKTGKRRKTWHELTFGNYYGPGNPDNDEYEPQSNTDYVGYKHDEEVNKHDIPELGNAYYYTFTDSDQHLLDTPVDTMSFSEAIANTAGKAFFTAKKALAKKHQRKPAAQKRHDFTPWKYSDGFKSVIFQKDMQLRGGQRADVLPTRDEPAIPEADMGVTTNTALRTASAPVTGTKRNGETVVENPYSRVRLHPYQRFQNVLMPYATTFAIGTVGAYTQTDSVRKMSIRTNSMYDIFNSAGFAEDVVPTAITNAPDATVQLPMYYKHWSQIYQYWCVTQMDYKITFVNVDPTGNSFGVNIVNSIWEYKHGVQEPPSYTDVSSGTERLQDKFRKLHPNARMKLMNHGRKEVFGDIQAQSVTFTGSVKPGQIEHDVMEDDYHNVWNKFGAAPLEREQLTYFIQLADVCQDMNLPDVQVVKPNFNAYVELVYHVQLKDLKRRWEYPTPKDDITFVDNYMDQS